MRLKRPVLLAFIAAIVVVSPVLAAAYSAPYTITEISSTAYTMLPVSVDVDNQWLADNGFMGADALDTRVETLGGLERPHMVATDRTLTSVAIGADSQTNLRFTTGSSDLTAVDVIAGYGGYLTIPDAAGLELADDFEIEIDGYIDTSAGSDKNLVYKEGAFRTSIGESGVIYSTIVGSLVSPTGFVDPDVAWINEANAFDNNTATFSRLSFAWTTPAQWTSFLELTLPAGTYIGGEVWVNELSGGSATAVDVDFFYGAAWNDAFEGPISTPGGGAVQQIFESAPAFVVTAARVRFFATGDGASDIDFYEFYAREGVAVAATGVASGEHIVETTADTADLKIFIDTVEEDSVALGGATVVDNANDWIINQDNVLPYLASYKHTVSSSLITRYEPNAIVINTGEAGTADAGTATTLDDAILTQANDYWNGARLIITDTTDDLAPKGENAVITDFDAANDRLIFAALTAVVGAGDTYTVDFGTMPDREAASNDARITWGVMPTGVVVVLGGMVSDAQPLPGLVVEDETIDVLPAVGVSDWFEEPDVGGTLLTNPLRPFVTMMSDTTTITELQAWRLLALAFILFVTVAALKAVRGHLLITGIAAGAAIGLAVAWTIYPLWALVFVVMAVVGGLVSERSPSL